ncbi:MAG TPA: hypothetical protein DHV59_09960 [Oxalobacteraceae bacterium]|nr:hypothetical protein [Oxalobacteraceae bacterium]
MPTPQNASDDISKYASELTRRFEEFTDWAIHNWPQKNYPLLPSDFAESRRELSIILGKRLNESESVPPPEAGGPQYVDVNPSPWP